MYRILALLLLVSVVFLGCAAEPTATPEPPPPPTEVPTDPPTATPEPTVTDIPTVAPTDTPPPTETPTPVTGRGPAGRARGAGADPQQLTIPDGNPYRGLRAFESHHRALFFGRAAEIRAVVERLRADAFVVVAGDSGVGKSSLCKAGVAPLIDEGELDPNRQWSSACITPGRYPLPTVLDALARLFELDEDVLEKLVKGGADELVRALRRQLGEGRGRLLVIDQFEELATLADPGDVAVVGPLLAHMTSGIPGPAFWHWPAPMSGNT